MRFEIEALRPSLYRRPAVPPLFWRKGCDSCPPSPCQLRLAAQADETPAFNSQLWTRNSQSWLTIAKSAHPQTAAGNPRGISTSLLLDLKSRGINTYGKISGDDRLPSHLPACLMSDAAHLTESRRDDTLIAQGGSPGTTLVDTPKPR